MVRLATRRLVKLRLPMEMSERVDEFFDRSGLAEDSPAAGRCYRLGCTFEELVGRTSFRFNRGVLLARE